MSQNSIRSLEEINEMLDLAKLKEDDIMSTSQVVYFANENIHEHNYKFLQLDQNLMKEIKEGQTLQIKGDDDENVVICTKNRTYHVTEAETSNSLLLVKGIKFFNEIKDVEERKVEKVEVSGIFYDYLEAVVGKPHLKKLRDILNQSLYKGPEYEFEIDKTKLVSSDDLNNMIQASDEELKEALNQLDIVIIENKVRLLDFEYRFRVLSYMLKLIDENSWQLDEIDYEETEKALTDLVSTDVLNSVFDKYTEESKIIDGLQLYRYKEYEICKFFAEVLLHGAAKFYLPEFLQAWKDSVPEGMVPDESMLYGVAVIDRKSNPNVISAFDEESLPENIIERLKVLFEIKEKWSVPEIAPYIKRLTTEKLDVNALLAKYARASKIDGVKFYSSKHGK